MATTDDLDGRKLQYLGEQLTGTNLSAKFPQNPLAGGSIAGHVSAKFKKQRGASRNADNELQNPLQRRTVALAFFCVPKRSAIFGD